MSVRAIIDKLSNKNILLLGFGKEGKSSYAFIRKYLPQVSVTVANKDELTDTSVFAHDPHTYLLTGKHYLDTINEYDIVLKSPGISLKHIIHSLDRNKISSQTDLFLRAFAPQCIGVTGTKGKSTTASFIYHVLKYLKNDTLLAGNIGIPLFDIVEDITPNTKIVLELSSHQLEFIRKSPHISILLNLFEEHLDHYNSLLDYQQAKLNIACYQSADDYFIYNTTDISIANLLKTSKITSNLVGFSLLDNPLATIYTKNQYFYKKEEKICEITPDFPLKGEHNLLNTTALIAAIVCMEDVDLSQIKDAVYSFHGLPHRLEFIGEFDGILFYNDSISTVPQASIAAVQSLKNVNTLILGGFDRGIDYQPLIDFIENSEIENIIFTGEAGKRMLSLSNNLKNKRLFFKESYTEIVSLAKMHTKKGSICLLSPAAASYDQFRNFEHRGDTFKKELEKLRS
jgi:UDP-N-acetylmuramoylalanine--D-glutamate ligase